MLFGKRKKEIEGLKAEIGRLESRNRELSKELNEAKQRIPESISETERAVDDLRKAIFDTLCVTVDGSDFVPVNKAGGIKLDAKIVYRLKDKGKYPYIGVEIESDDGRYEYEYSYMNKHRITVIGYLHDEDYYLKHGSNYKNYGDDHDFYAKWDFHGASQESILEFVKEAFAVASERYGLIQKRKVTEKTQEEEKMMIQKQFEKNSNLMCSLADKYKSKEE